MAGQLAQALSSHEGLKLINADLSRQVQSLSLLVAELEQSGNDLGRQVQNLLRQIALAQNPALGEVQGLPSAPPDVLSADLALGSDQVVLFENLHSLQAQNQMLLRVAHSSALALDQKEREFREIMEREESDAIREANQAISVLEEQLESLNKSHGMKLQAYSRELELVKSTGPNTRRSALPILHAEAGDTSTANSTQLELQNQFEAYRIESETDTARLRSELDKIQFQANRTAAELAKANGTIQFMNGMPSTI